MTKVHICILAVGMTVLVTGGCGGAEPNPTIQLTIYNRSAAALFISDTPAEVFSLLGQNFSISRPGYVDMCDDSCSEICAMPMGVHEPLEGYLEIPPGGRWTYHWEGWLFTRRQAENCPCVTQCAERSAPQGERIPMTVTYYSLLTNAQPYTSHDDGTTRWVVQSGGRGVRPRDRLVQTFILQRESPSAQTFAIVGI